MEERNMPKADFLTSIILMAFGVSILVHSVRMPRFQEFGADPFSVPGIVPGILGIIITILSFVVFARAVRRKGYRIGVSAAATKTTAGNPAFVRMIVTCLVCVVYALGLVGRANYYAATFLFVFAFLILFQFDRSKTLAGQKKMLAGSATQAVLISGAVGAVFRYLFLVDLP